MAILKKTTVVAKPAAKPAAKAAAKPVAKPAMKPYDNSKYLADSTAKAPMVRQRKQEYTRDSTKMENAAKTMDSISKVNSRAMLISPEDANKYKAAKDTFGAASGRVIKTMKGDVSQMKKAFTITPSKKKK
jgi:cytochrome c556